MDKVLLHAVRSRYSYSLSRTIKSADSRIRSVLPLEFCAQALYAHLWCRLPLYRLNHIWVPSFPWIHYLGLKSNVDGIHFLRDQADDHVVEHARLGR
jgi:hypothetical protein